MANTIDILIYYTTTRIKNCKFTSLLFLFVALMYVLIYFKWFTIHFINFLIKCVLPVRLRRPNEIIIDTN